MMNLEQLKAKRDIVNDVDWSMTPEKAVEMYLEWGTGWVRGNDFVASAGDESIYFVLFDWEPPNATLIRRTMEGAEEIAKLQVPEELFADACREDGKGASDTVHPPNKALKEWLREQIDGPPLDWSRV